MSDSDVFLERVTFVFQWMEKKNPLSVLRKPQE